MKKLMPDEKIVLQARISWKRLIPAIILTFAVLVLAIASTILDAGGPLFFILALLMALAIASMYLDHISDVLILTNKRVYGKVGIFNTKSMDTPIGKINNISVERPLNGKMYYNYGTIHIASLSGEYYFPYIDDPDTFRNAVMEAIDQAENDRIKKQAEEIAAAMKK